MQNQTDYSHIGQNQGCGPYHSTTTTHGRFERREPPNVTALVQESPAFDRNTAQVPLNSNSQHNIMII